MIKIAFVIDTIESPTAGTEKQLLMLIKYLDRSIFHPYLCVLRSSEWLEREFKLCQVFVANIHSFKKILGVNGVFILSRFFKSESIDIIQTHFRDSSIAGIFAAKLSGCKVIIGTRRNQGYWYTPRELFIQKILNRWVSIFIANSKNTKDWAARVEGIAPENIQVIYNGIEIEHFCKATKFQRLAFREKVGFPSDAVIIGIVANLRPVKAIDIFIRAASFVAAKEPQARFIIIGDGPERATLENLCHDFNLESKLLFLGKCLDVPNVLGCIDVGVLSSKSESFSNAIIEYLAASLPVVCTDVGGASEAIGECAGFLVPAGDWHAMGEKLIELINSDKRIVAGKEGRERCQNLFSREGMISQSQDLLLKIKKGHIKI